ncbi:MAG: hypothetical protein E6H04_10065 [Bacillati bacterium ANGP1]|uniref:DUF2630 family protein n=1 Tax=Candidatus Segetimicrobium genomatis TaxID=2569760 RepID=A0A537J858_9BACT|nr:MAG: hypothetical protein E6H04_10065 [Terrabacteria group bacterium ANGP1]
MTETTTLEKIRKLAERRQALWSKAPALTIAERADIVRLTTELEGLWEQHRTELARSQASRRGTRTGPPPSRGRSAA